MVVILRRDFCFWKWVYFYPDFLPWKGESRFFFFSSTCVCVKILNDLTDFNKRYVIWAYTNPFFVSRVRKYCERRLLASSCLSVRPSVCPHGSTRLPLVEFHEIWYLSIFRISFEKIQVPLKSDKNKSYFTWRPIYILDHILLSSFWMKHFSDESCRENRTTHFIFNKFIYLFFLKSYRLWHNVEKYGRAGQATDDNMAHAHCLLDT